MSDLLSYRNQIDEIDTQIRQLFIKRMNLVKEIAEYKMAHDIAVYDSSRELEVIAKNIESLEDKSYQPYYQSVIEEMMKVSKEYQKALILRSTYEQVD
ncbi:MAG: chorismate mutase [Candidatus Izemoplasmatales bacterium]|nr:chorismate mutase [bacterium]MDZ4196572.1 chorismate mutase [Candidatus Izemoplasmatales bacterium]